MTQNHRFTVDSIKATVRKGTTIPGDYFVNDSMWISRNELQSWFLGQEKAVPPANLLKGATFTVDIHEMTQEMIDKAIAEGKKAKNRSGEWISGYVININGRDTAFTKPGLKYVLKNISLSGCDFSAEKLDEIAADTAIFELNAARAKHQLEMRRMRRDNQPVGRTTPTTVDEEETVNDEAPTPAATPVVNEPAGVNDTQPVVTEEHADLTE